MFSYPRERREKRRLHGQCRLVAARRTYSGLARAGLADDEQAEHAHQQTSDYEVYVNNVPVVGEDVDKPDHGGEQPGYNGQSAYGL